MIDYKREIDNLIAPMSYGIKAVVPIPNQTNYLTKLANQYSSIKEKQVSTRKNIQDWQANAKYWKCQEDTALMKLEK